jgi:hypothetical protein
LPHSKDYDGDARKAPLDQLPLTPNPKNEQPGNQSLDELPEQIQNDELNNEPAKIERLPLPTENEHKKADEMVRTVYGPD